ncbi:MAG TPA: CDP-alcohol phosphatidyltransferase family protein [Bacteroidota bacterium]
MQRIRTISNLISVSRVAFVLPAAYCLMADFPNHRAWAIFFIFVASSTDFFDGFLARKLHEVTDFGKIVDPLADKIGIGIIAVCLLLTGDIPLWYFAAVVARDALIFVGGIYIKKNKQIVPQANMAGKITVNIIALALLLCIVRIPALEPLRIGVIWLSVLFMIVSLIVYAKRLFIGRTLTQKS